MSIRVLIFLIISVTVLFVYYFKTSGQSHASSIFGEWRKPRSSISEIKCEFYSKNPGNVVSLLSNIAIPQHPIVSFHDAWLKPDYARFGAALPEIPKVLLSQYTMNGQVPIRNYFFDQAYLGAKAMVSHWSLELVQNYIDRARKRQMNFNYYNGHVYQTLDKYAKESVLGKRGLVIGSENPWLEAILLEYGAAHVTTLEFGEIRNDHPRLSSITPRDLTREFVLGKYQNHQFDFVFSFSSIEHDGLGRYGDILNPDADLQMMSRVMTILKPGGIFYLALMTGPDAIEFNAHRIYGSLRYPQMMAGYHFIESFGKENEQPVMVLQNKYGCSNGIKFSSIFFV